MSQSNQSNELSRRNFLKGMAATLGALSVGGIGYSLIGRRSASNVAQEVSELAPVSPVTITTASGLRVHGIQTGWITIKTNHYRLRGPESLRLPSIMADTTWTEPKPMLSWIIEHPEGLTVIDTGECSGARDLGTYVACADPGNSFFITRNFRVNVESESELGPQLINLGLEPNDVRWVVQTHLHFDHANGFAFVPNAEILVSRAELEGHRQQPVGAVNCLYPSDFSPTALDYKEQSYKTFENYFALTKAEDVVIIPTHGHSYGHQAILLRDNDKTFFFAGDVVFDERQLLEREVAGIVHDVAQTKDSMERTRAFITSTPTVFLPSHDPNSLQRLSTQQLTTIKGA
jgi:N-acyl homoserine lactone hydrolase